MQRAEISKSFPIGAKLPEFSLLATDGNQRGSADLKNAKAALVVFTCNHCPYVKGSEEMLIAVVNKFKTQGLVTLAINANDASQYPEDSYEMMQDKAKKFDLPYYYLHDQDQSVAKAFDAACTPECYLFDSNLNLAFHGTISDNVRDARAVKVDYLSSAITQVLASKPCTPNYVHPVGCSIKWK